MGAVLLVEDEGPVRTLTLNRPEVRNALSSELMGRLVEELRGAEAAGVGAVVLTGAGQAFCAGLDLTEVSSTGLDLGFVDDPARSPWLALHDLRVPVIGAVNGPAITGGLELALQCTFLVASERAVFGDTHARIGVHPGGGLTVLLARAIGVRRAREMSLTGEFLPAAEAQACGLVNRVVAPEELLPTARRLAGLMAANHREAVLAINEMYREAVERPAGDALALERERFRDWGLPAEEIAVRKKAVLGRGDRS